MTQLNPVSLTVDQQKISLYAEVSDDYNPIHIDPDFAARTAMGGVIAHGTMSLNLIWQSLRGTFPQIDWQGVSIDIRFLRPVRLGDTITGGGRALENGAGYEIWVVNQKDEQVIKGTAVVPTAAAPARRAVAG
jgi:3-hydroxybutyryl-CoA dehydratase